MVFFAVLQLVVSRRTRSVGSSLTSGSLKWDLVACGGLARLTRRLTKVEEVFPLQKN